jgi:hypothetical protein
MSTAASLLRPEGAAGEENIASATLTEAACAVGESVCTVTDTPRLGKSATIGCTCDTCEDVLRLVEETVFESQSVDCAG